MGKWLLESELKVTAEKAGEVFVSRDQKKYTIIDVDSRGIIYANPEGVEIPKGFGAWNSFKEKEGLIKMGAEPVVPMASEELTEKDIELTPEEVEKGLEGKSSLTPAKQDFPHIDMYCKEIQAMYHRHGFVINDWPKFKDVIAKHEGNESSQELYEAVGNNNFEVVIKMLGKAFAEKKDVPWLLDNRGEAKESK